MEEPMIRDTTAIVAARPKRGRLPRLSRLRVVAVVSAGLAGPALFASACGGSSASQVAQSGSTATAQPNVGSGPSAAGKYASSLAYSRCMRSHGVSDFPYPKQVGGGIQISGSRSGINPQSPLFMSAQQSCRHLLPGGQSTRAGQQQALARMLQISQCMRAHGISRFPDPTLSPPSNRAGYSEIRSNGLAWLAIPDSIAVRSPVFKHAAAACKL
jgi:hypothetical protein